MDLVLSITNGIVSSKTFVDSLILLFLLPVVKNTS